MTRTIGELVGPILEKAASLAALQIMMNETMPVEVRRAWIVSAYEHGILEPDSARLLMEAYLPGVA